MDRNDKQHHGRSDDGNAFLPDPFGEPGPRKRHDASGDLAEEMGEEFVTGATGNVDATEQEQEKVDEAEAGGPFLLVDGSEEFADGVDEQNPDGATREAFPSPMRGDLSSS